MAHAKPQEVQGSLVVDVAVGERVALTVPPTMLCGRTVNITLLKKSGQRARLRIATDDEVEIQPRAPKPPC